MPTEINEFQSKVEVYFRDFPLYIACVCVWVCVYVWGQKLVREAGEEERAR